MTLARTAAYRVLQAVINGANLPQALARNRDSLTDHRDRSLVTEITSGTFRWLAVLDHVIQGATGRPNSRIDPEVMTVLRLGVYQLLYLERVPPSAAVNESVHLVRKVGKASASGMVNAVLRRVAVTRNDLKLPPEPRASDSTEVQLAFLSLTCSHPQWLVQRWLERLGFPKTVNWVRFNNTPPPLTLRANRLRITPEHLARRLAKHGVTTEPTRFARDGLVVISGNPFRGPLAAEGLFLAQDEASQLVAELVAPCPGERILDACAAPGGKTTALAASLSSDGMLVASDFRFSRLRLLKQIVTEFGAAGAQLVQLDLRQPAPFAPVFDKVLVDAPCSGLGILRRDPEIRWRRQAEDLRRYAKEQLTIVSQAAAAVRPGGRLVYATCSGEPEENDDVVMNFLSQHTDFETVPINQLDPLARGLRRALDERGRIVTTPPTHQLESFFAVTLRRRTP